MPGSLRPRLRLHFCQNFRDGGISFPATVAVMLAVAVGGNRALPYPMNRAPDCKAGSTEDNGVREVVYRATIGGSTTRFCFGTAALDVPSMPSPMPNAGTLEGRLERMIAPIRRFPREERD